MAVASSSGQSVSFTDVQAPHNVTATFAISTFNITVIQGVNGVIAPDNTTVAYGGSQVFTITPSTGYSIASITVDGGSVAVASSSGQSVSFTDVQAPHNVTATFAISTFNITVIQGVNGVIAPDNTTVAYGGSQVFTITPDAGYYLASLNVDGYIWGLRRRIPSVMLLVFTRLRRHLH